MMYEVSLFTGIRLGEILALSWRDIDLEQQKVTVRRNVSAGGIGNERIVQMRNGSRTIMLPQQIVTKLQQHKQKQRLMKEQLGERYNNELDLVFPNKNGQIQNSSMVRGKFSRLIAKADVRKITFHDLRKMHIIMLIEAGISPVFIKNHLGHMAIETTLNKFLKR
jgi:integrase